MGIVFDPLRLAAVAMDVLSSGRATAQALRDRQKARLTALMEAAQNSPIYIERLQGVSPRSATLSDVPAVTRAELMARFDEWVTDPQIKLADLQAFVADPSRIGQPFLGKYLVWESSGTSHQPGVFVQDARAMAVFDALEALRRDVPRPLLRWFDPMLQAERMAFIGAIDGHYPGMVTVQRLRQLNPWLAHSLRWFSIFQPLPALLEDLNTFAPTVIATYPSMAALLAEAQAQGGLKFLPKEIWTGGETLSSAVRAHLEATFGGVVRNSYGASEFMSIAWECARGCLHVNSDWVILEPVDAAGRAVPAGQASHSTLLTNLANHVQPLIRYDIGDLVRVSSQPCACGASLPVIDVQGRCDDVLAMADLHGKLVTVLPMALTSVLEEQAGVFSFQLQQVDARTLVLRLDLDPASAQPVVMRCRQALDQFALSQGLAEINLLPEWAQTLGKGGSGKARRVVACLTGT